MRIIDADELIRKMRNDVPIKLFGSMKNLGNVIGIVEDAPTVDAVEVVRCKDCKHKSVYCTTVDCNMRTTYIYFCVLHGTYHEHDWFCADGERKEE